MCSKPEPGAFDPKPALGYLPYTETPNNKYSVLSAAKFLESGFNLLEQIELEGVEAVIASLSKYGNPVSATLYNLGESCSLKEHLFSALYPTWDAGDKQFALDWNDYLCTTCDHYVSKIADFEHWDTICGTCSTHKLDESGEPVKGCDCCRKCGYERCECCVDCGNSPGWCECCIYCGAQTCECPECRNCGEKSPNCSCSHYSSGVRSFGKSKSAPWTKRDKPVMPLETVPKMSECDNDNIDPIQAAADFYLLDAIKNNVRMNYIKPDNDNASARLAGFDPKSDDRLSALHLAASRSYNSLVERLDRSLLAYAVSVCGGELRYHKALSNKLPSSRSSAWGAFTKIVEENGADVLFDAVDLFEEFGSSSYGGHKWAQIAQVTAQRLSGKMPAWLFVDRIITLQHNGGCVLNKVGWAQKNGLHWDLYQMQNFLNAHAGVCLTCGQKPGEDDYCRCGGPETPNRTVDADWDLLLRAASPGVADMFRMSESCLQRIARRVGAEMPRVPVSPQFARSRTRRAGTGSGPCGNCGYYSCECF